MSEQREAPAETVARTNRIAMWREQILDPDRDEDLTPLAPLLDAFEADIEQRIAERVAAAEALHGRVPSDSPFNREGRDVCGTCMDGFAPADWPCPTIAALTPGAADRVRAEHDCETCETCLHNGNKCCGCYDGACCQETNQ